MAKKKKDESVSEERRTNVLLEEMRSDIKRIAEGHSSLVDRFDKVDRRFDAVDKRFDIVEAAVSENGRDIKELKSTVKQLQTGQEELKGTVKELKETVNQNTGDIKEIKTTVGQINGKLDRVLTDHEDRLKKLEVIRQ